MLITLLCLLRRWRYTEIFDSFFKPKDRDIFIKVKKLSRYCLFTAAFIENVIIYNYQLLYTIFYIGILGFIIILVNLCIIRTFNYFKVLLLFELIFLALTYLLIYFSILHGVLEGILFFLCLLGVFAAETALGLSLFSHRLSSKLIFKLKKEKSKKK